MRISTPRRPGPRSKRKSPSCAPAWLPKTKVGGAADDVPAPAPTTIDLTNRQPVIGHADVVNVYNGPVTIYQGSAPASDHQSPSMSDNG